MGGNITPYIILGAVVLVALAWKGYIKLPSKATVATSASPSAASPTQLPAPMVSPFTPSMFQSRVEALAKEGGYILGVAFATAKKAEAEQHIAQQAAEKIGADLHDVFTAPFASAPTPNPPAVPPAPAAAPQP